MSETKWTKGDWTCDGSSRVYAKRSGKDWQPKICTTDNHGVTSEEAIANAHLIASAPALYAALEAAVQHTWGDTPLHKQCLLALNAARGEKERSK